jgi:hypothetical protein
VNHTTSSASPIWDNLVVDGLVAHVHDPSSLLFATPRRVSVWASSYNEAFPNSFTISLRLTAKPTANVEIVTDIASRGFDATPSLRIIAPQVHIFTPTNWMTEQTITVKAIHVNDSAVSYKTSLIFTAYSNDERFNEATMPTVTVDVVDAVRAPIMYRPFDTQLILLEGSSTGIGGQVSWTKVIFGVNNLNAYYDDVGDGDGSGGGGGPIASSRRLLTTGLSFNPMVTVSTAPNDQLLPFVVFLSLAQATQVVTLHPLDDTLHNGERDTLLTIISTTEYNTVFDTPFQMDGSNGPWPPPLVVRIEDDDVAGVVVIESPIGTDIIEPDSTMSNGRTATYQIALTKPIVDSVTVTPFPLKTPQSPEEITDGTAQIQVATDLTSVTFTSSTWNTLQTVTVHAFNDRGGRTDYQSYPFKLRRPDILKGPLYISGGIDVSVDFEAGPALMLPGETDASSFNLTSKSCFYPNFFADETKQVDSVILHNENCLLDGQATLIDSVLLGLDMSGPLVSGNSSFLGGITFHGIEHLTVMFGSGSDNILINSSMSRIILQMAGGNDMVTLLNASSHTVVVDLGSGNFDAVFIKTSDILEGNDTLWNSPVTVWSDPTNNGIDVCLLSIDDTLSTNDSTWLLQPNLVTSSRMVTPIDFNKVYFLQVPQGSQIGSFQFSFTSLQRTSIPIVWDNFMEAFLSSDAISDALQALVFPSSHSCGTSEPPITQCAPSFYVYQMNDIYVIELIGELNGPNGNYLGDMIIATTSIGDMTLVKRGASITYAGVTTLDMHHGSGIDLLNLRGLYKTQLQWNGNDGDDAVFISSTANVSLTERLDFRYLDGQLDNITGPLSFWFGHGVHTMAISDHDSNIGHSNIVMTSSSIDGLLPGGSKIRFFTDPTTSDFGDGIAIWLSNGDDNMTITGTPQVNMGLSQSTASWTAIYSGDGNDHITAALTADIDGDVFIHLGDGNDYFSGSQSTRDLIVVGSNGQDIIITGDGNDIVLGDDGQILSADQSTLQLRSNGCQLSSRQRDSLLPLFVSTLVSAHGDSDTITTAGGRDIVLGGESSDTIDTGNDYDAIIGDAGQVIITDSFNLQLDSYIQTSGNDIVTDLGDGAIVIGCGGDDTITVDTLYSEVAIIGDFGTMTLTNGQIVNLATTGIGGISGDDNIDANARLSLILGGGHLDKVSTRGRCAIIGADDGSIIRGIVLISCFLPSVLLVLFFMVILCTNRFMAK